MQTVIETERLRLRPYVEADAPRVLDILSRMDVIRWLGNPPYNPMAGLDDAREWITRKNLRVEEAPFERTPAVEVRSTGVVAGTVMISRMFLPGQDWAGEYEIGWHLHPDSVGHGYATEAAAALLDDAFADGLEHIWAGMFPENELSARVAIKLGLRELGYGPDPWYGGIGRLFDADREWWQERQSRA